MQEMRAEVLQLMLTMLVFPPYSQVLSHPGPAFASFVLFFFLISASPFFLRSEFCCRSSQSSIPAHSWHAAGSASVSVKTPQTQVGRQQQQQGQQQQQQQGQQLKRRPVCRGHERRAQAACVVGQIKSPSRVKLLLAGKLFAAEHVSLCVRGPGGRHHCRLLNCWEQLGARRTETAPHQTNSVLWPEFLKAAYL